MPFCKDFTLKLVNSLRLLMSLVTPAKARVGVDLSAPAQDDPVLALPPMSCTADAVRRRFTGAWVC